MAVPNVDTFEHDIADEIKNKEASLTDIASAGGDLGNMPSSDRNSKAFIAFGVFVVIAVLAGGGWYVWFANPTSQANDLVTTQDLSPSSRVASLSPTLHDAVGGDIKSVVKSEYGYTLTLFEYSPVFAYMIKNESEYADELAISLGSGRDTSTTTEAFAFTDITLRNQNMRVGVSGDKQIVYAFADTKTLLIASSTEGILALKGILK